MRLVPERNPLARWLALPAVLIALAGFAAARWWPDLLLRMARCPWRDVTGVPCPTCGGTHAATALALGDVAAAWAANPAVPLGAAALAVWAAWAAIAGALPAWRVRVALSAGEKRAARWGTALLVVVLWVRQAIAL